MVSSLSTYRVYANSMSSLEYLPNANLDGELHIVVPFARDYDNGNAYMVGNFLPYFNTTDFSAQAIKDFKRKSQYTEIKFFLSIGGRDPRFPFAVASADESTWIQNAMDSLKKIVEDYGFDGIDVYYEHIEALAENQFANSVFEVITKLKLREKVISTASMTVSARVNNRYYELFKKGDKRFDYVVYQAHNETYHISNVKDLEPIFNGLRYPKDMILAGHSDVPTDWAYVTPPIFLGVVPLLLNGAFAGFSKWIVTPNNHNPEA